MARGNIELVRDTDRPNGWWLLVDEVVQSMVDLSNPSFLKLAYAQWMACVIDQLPQGGLDAAHIGGGGCTLPRYLEAIRPGSRQIVFEPDAELIACVSEHLALATVPGLRVRPVDGLAGIGELAPRSMDLLVLDAFSGAMMPPELATADFARKVSEIVRPAGVYLINVLDDGDLGFTQRVMSAVGETFEHVLVIADPPVLDEYRIRNLVIAASHNPLPIDAIRQRATSTSTPGSCVEAGDLKQLRDLVSEL